VVIPDSVKKIDERAFAYCSSIREIVIPDSIETVEKEAFYGCDALTVTYCGKQYTHGGNEWKDLYDAIKANQ